LLKQALGLVVDAVAEAERYAGTHGLSLQFTNEDVRESDSADLCQRIAVRRWLMTGQEAWRPAEVLSPSQVILFLNCAAKWYFRYFLDLPEPATTATPLGKAFHEAIAHNFRHKLQTRSDLPSAEGLESFQSSLGRHLENVAFGRGVNLVYRFDKI
jgi:PD-(D/E)XK nuclease superfamily